VLAARIHRYGDPGVFKIEEVDKPAPGPRDVLVRVCATSVNPVDWKTRSGGQRNVMRYKLPWILGLDVSGVVEAVGSSVSKLKVGDEVWSSPTHSRPGTYAQYVCIDERECSLKPKSLSHEEAASIPLVGLTAYQCLVDTAHLRKGERVLIHAGSGGVGSFAIQLAKHLGAHVITTCSKKNEELVRSLGADEVIDYREGNFADKCEPVDVVLDPLGEDSFDDNVRVLKKGGRISNITLDVSGAIERWGTIFSVLALGLSIVRMMFLAWARKGAKHRHVMKRCDGAQLQVIADLVDKGAIKPLIDRVLPLEQIDEAHRYGEQNRTRGKIVVRVA
jgi:NADPH:quinone reductase-like Zn-dependent oxidoreductase